MNACRGWLVLIALWGAIAAACAESTGSAWVRGSSDPDEHHSGVRSSSPSGSARRWRTWESKTIGEAPAAEQPDEEPVAAEARGRPLGVFRNTYYSFPSASDYSGPLVTVFDPACRPLTSVPRTFHDQLCVQGSGQLASRQTISFASRDCSCAEVCPRSGQRICFHLLDPKQFPWGRGAAGKPNRPCRTVATDTKVIALGTSLYIPSYVGMPLHDGGVHDGCFRAEDRGIRVVGNQIDVFVGSQDMLRHWNAKVPTGKGVEVFEDERCAQLQP